TVIEELQKGYYLNDRVIRTAKVKVSKKKDNV
ncbi:nucleotide exchange factor GrpE, partial [bacterium]